MMSENEHRSGEFYNILKYMTHIFDHIVLPDGHEPPLEYKGLNHANA